jgi:hypothetical protein
MQRLQRYNAVLSNRPSSGSHTALAIHRRRCGVMLQWDLFPLELDKAVTSEAIRRAEIFRHMIYEWDLPPISVGRFTTH